MKFATSRPRSRKLAAKLIMFACTPIAVVEQKFPFALLDLAAEQFRRPIAFHGSLAHVGKDPGIPRGLSNSPTFRVGRQASRFGTKHFENWMLAHAIEPVLGISEIAFPAMHDAVPVASTSRVDVLTDPVRFIQEIVVEPETSETTPGHIVIAVARILKNSLNRELTKLLKHQLIRCTRAEFHQSRFLQNRGDGRTVYSWFLIHS